MRIKPAVAAFAALAAALLVVAPLASAGRSDLVKPPPLELTAVFQHDCGDFEILLSGTLERFARFTLGDQGADVAEHRQVRISGVVYNSTDPSKSAPYVRSMQIDFDYLTGRRSIAGTTHVVVPGQGVVLHASGIRVEDWTGIDFETVFPALLFQGGRFDTFADDGWDRLCAALR